MREAAGVIDLTRVPDLRHRGPGRARLGAADLRRAVRRAPSARSIYTPVLDAKGGFRSDLTVMRLGDDHFRVVTGGAHGMADRKWFTDHLVRRRRRLTDRTDEISTIGLWGPRARDILGVAHRRRRLRRGLRLPDLPRDHRRAWTSPCSPRGSPTSASSAGSSTCRWTTPPSCGSALLDAGKDHGTVPVGIGVYGTTGRHREGLPRLRLRARRRAHHRRGRHAAAQGQGRRLRRPGGLPGPARGATPARRCSAR